MISLNRKVEFEASHFYRSSDLSRAENEARYGLAARPHGHNWVLRAQITGEIDPTTGMVVNIKDLDDLLNERIVSQLDHTCLNLDHPAFLDKLPTTENLAVYIWRELVGAVGRCDLKEIMLHESDYLWSRFRGELSGRTRWPMVYVTRAYEFSASHRLHNPSLSPEQNKKLYGKCNNPNGHGHNYRLEVTIKGELDEATGMIVDLEALDETVRREAVERFDHQHMNDLDAFAETPPTTENVVKRIYESLAPHFAGGDPELQRVRLYETHKSWFDYGAIA